MPCHGMGATKFKPHQSINQWLYSLFGGLADPSDSQFSDCIGLHLTWVFDSRAWRRPCRARVPSRPQICTTRLQPRAGARAWSQPIWVAPCWRFRAAATLRLLDSACTVLVMLMQGASALLLSSGCLTLHAAHQPRSRLVHTWWLPWAWCYGSHMLSRLGRGTLL